ncbi:ABC transporter permease subunit [Streptomyces sp. NPDC056601]|uniref:ABC transporter permease subunit n=1 Tax=Streptomyces sp. NPDC056601 TaxID=3345875 RepID=UPI0036ADF2BC
MVRHVLRNALIPLATLLGLYLPTLFSGALVVESMVNYPGMGLLFWNTAQGSDFPVLLVVTLVVGIATVLGSPLTDILYAVLDPRIRSVARVRPPSFPRGREVEPPVAAPRGFPLPVPEEAAAQPV